MSRERSWFRSLLRAEDDEVLPLLWSFAYFFCLLSGYYILRPVRDEMAIEGGVQHLPWMMTATFFTLLAVTPLFGWLAGRYARGRLLLGLYTFFAVNLIVFYALMAHQVLPEWVARVFFVWVSIFNLFVVSVFWSLMADLFTAEQGIRLFGVIAAGGSTGALAGPLLTTSLTFVLPIPMLMLVSAIFLVACMICIYRLDRWARHRPQSRPGDNGGPIGGSILSGIRLAVSSPYLLGICAYLFVLTMSATVLYLEQTRLISQEITTAQARTRLFSEIDLITNLLSWLAQVFLTNRLINRFGLVSALMLLPVVSAVGFSLIGFNQTLLLFLIFTIVRRVGEYAISKPAREVLFTVVTREEKYKAKNFIDTAVSRGGDASTGWLVAGVKALGATTAHLAWMLVPIMLVWSWLAWFLAQQERRLQTTKALHDVASLYGQKNRML